LGPVDDPERADAGTDAVPVAGFRIHGKKCHGISPLVQIDRQRLRWFGTGVRHASTEAARG